MTEWQRTAYEEKEEIMALTRKFLSALGIEADKIDEIITAHTDTVDGLKEDLTKYKSKAESYDEAKKELDEIKKTSGKEDSYKVKYEAVKQEFDDYKKEITNKETLAKKSEAYRKLLTEVGINEKLLDKVLAVTKLDDIELEGDNIKDADKVTDSIKSEWGDFIVKTKQEGETTKTPPKGTGTKMTKEQVMAIKDTAERQKAILENHEEFGF